jgi:hypothetical protein
MLKERIDFPRLLFLLELLEGNLSTFPSGQQHGSEGWTHSRQPEGRGDGHADDDEAWMC